MPSGTLYQRTALAAAISACFPALALGAGVARVDFATGQVTAVAPDGRSRALSRGSEINVGETVATQQGRAQLRFADGAYMSLQPQTEFKVDEFKFSGKEDASDNIVMSLLKGGMRTITGLIGRANRNNYKLRTDVATIGIRGTEYSVQYTNSIEVFCADGQILVQNEGGTLQLNGGQGGYVASNTTQPQQTENRPVLPPESPVSQQIEQQTEQVEEPVNPVQEAVPPVPTPTSPAILTGTIQGYWAVSLPFDGTFGSLQSNSDPMSITLNASGAATSLSMTDMFEGSTLTLTSGTATPVSLGNDGIIAWGRWVDGRTGGDFYGFQPNLASPFEGPLHYVVGLPATNMPTSGEATYSMMGSSISATVGSASVVSSSIAVNFANPSATFHGRFDVNGGIYATGTSGITLSRSGPHMQGSGSFATFPGCCGSSISLQGFFAGDGASRAGMGFSFFGQSEGVNGVIAYKKN